MSAGDFTRCFECGHDVHVDEWDEHACPPDPRNGPYDLDRFDEWVDDEEEERDS